MTWGEVSGGARKMGDASKTSTGRGRLPSRPPGTPTKAARSRLTVAHDRSPGTMNHGKCGIKNATMDGGR
jgi:hypothetical protein